MSTICVGECAMPCDGKHESKFIFTLSLGNLFSLYLIDCAKRDNVAKGHLFGTATINSHLGTN